MGSVCHILLFQHKIAKAFTKSLVDGASAKGKMYDQVSTAQVTFAKQEKSFVQKIA